MSWNTLKHEIWGPNFWAFFFILNVKKHVLFATATSFFEKTIPSPRFWGQKRLPFGRSGLPQRCRPTHGTGSVWGRRRPVFSRTVPFDHHWLQQALQPGEIGAFNWSMVHRRNEEIWIVRKLQLPSGHLCLKSVWRKPFWEASLVSTCVIPSPGPKNCNSVYECVRRCWSRIHVWPYQSHDFFVLLCDSHSLLHLIQQFCDLDCAIGIRHKDKRLAVELVRICDAHGHIATPTFKDLGSWKTTIYEKNYHHDH